MDIQEHILPYMESRTDFYRMLAKLYRWPLSQEELEAFDSEAFKTLSDDIEEVLMSEGFNDIYRFLRRRNTGTRQVLNADYTRVFLGVATYEGFSAQPYASLFMGDDHQLMGAERTAVSRIYRENGVRLSEGIDLPEDHLGFECDFLAIVNERATLALKEGDFRRAKKLLKVEKSFIEDHVLPWLPRFCALAGKLIETRFYRGVLKVTRGFFEEEVGAIGSLLEDVDDLSAGLRPMCR